MTQKIDKLTEAQLAKTPEYLEKWTKIGLSTDPCNFEEAKKHASAAYVEAGLKPPTAWALTNSPYDSAICSALLQNKSLTEINEFCLDPYNVQSKIDRFNIETLNWRTKPEVKTLCERADLRQGVSAQVYGSHDAGWLSLYDFVDKELGLHDIVKPLYPLIELSKVCGWWAPYDDCCILQHRHDAVHLNAQGLLHDENGPAVSYPKNDGPLFAVWAINGIILDEQIIMTPETQTIRQIETDDVSDRKAIRIERFGWSRYLKDTGSKPIDARENAIEGTYESLYIAPDGTRRFVVPCPTGRVFAMGVPAEITTCEQAAAWLIGADQVDGEKVRIVGRT